MKTQLDNFHLCERGNTLLVSEDGDMVAWLDLDGDRRLEVTWHPDNYPALNVQTTTLTDEQLVAHINTNLQGWYPRKCNLEGVNMDVDMVAYADILDEHTLNVPEQVKVIAPEPNHNEEYECPECLGYDPEGTCPNCGLKV